MAAARRREPGAAGAAAAGGGAAARLARFPTWLMVNESSLLLGSKWGGPLFAVLQHGAFQLYRVGELSLRADVRADAFVSARAQLSDRACEPLALRLAWGRRGSAALRASGGRGGGSSSRVPLGGRGDQTGEAPGEAADAGVESRDRGGRCLYIIFSSTRDRAAWMAKLQDLMPPSNVTMAESAEPGADGAVLREQHEQPVEPPPQPLQQQQQQTATPAQQQDVGGRMSRQSSYLLKEALRSDEVLVQGIALVSSLGYSSSGRRQETDPIERRPWSRRYLRLTCMGELEVYRATLVACISLHSADAQILIEDPRPARGPAAHGHGHAHGHEGGDSSQSPSLRLGGARRIKSAASVGFGKLAARAHSSGHGNSSSAGNLDGALAVQPLRSHAALSGTSNSAALPSPSSQTSAGAAADSGEASAGAQAASAGAGASPASAAEAATFAAAAGADPQERLSGSVPPVECDARDKERSGSSSGWSNASPEAVVPYQSDSDLDSSVDDDSSDSDDDSSSSSSSGGGGKSPEALPAPPPQPPRQTLNSKRSASALGSPAGMRLVASPPPLAAAGAIVSAASPLPVDLAPPGFVSSSGGDAEGGERRWRLPTQRSLTSGSSISGDMWRLRSYRRDREFENGAGSTPPDIFPFTVSGKSVKDVPMFPMERRSYEFIRVFWRQVAFPSTVTVGAPDERSRRACTGSIRQYVEMCQRDDALRLKIATKSASVLAKCWMLRRTVRVRGRFPSLWKRRFCVLLSSSELVTYKDEMDGSRRRVVDLSGVAPEGFRLADLRGTQGERRRALVFSVRGMEYQLALADAAAPPEGGAASAQLEQWLQGCRGLRDHPAPLPAAMQQQQQQQQQQHAPQSPQDLGAAVDALLMLVPPARPESQTSPYLHASHSPAPGSSAAASPAGVGAARAQAGQSAECASLMLVEGVGAALAPLMLPPSETSLATMTAQPLGGLAHAAGTGARRRAPGPGAQVQVQAQVQVHGPDALAQSGADRERAPSLAASSVSASASAPSAGRRRSASSLHIPPHSGGARVPSHSRVMSMGSLASALSLGCKSRASSYDELQSRREGLTLSRFGSDMGPGHRRTKSGGSWDDVDAGGPGLLMSRADLRVPKTRVVERTNWQRVTGNLPIQCLSLSPYTGRLLAEELTGTKRLDPVPVPPPPPAPPRPAPQLKVKREDSASAKRLSLLPFFGT